jgi:hypothetical protein
MSKMSKIPNNKSMPQRSCSILQCPPLQSPKLPIAISHGFDIPLLINRGVEKHNTTPRFEGRNKSKGEENSKNAKKSTKASGHNTHTQ